MLVLFAFLFRGGSTPHVRLQQPSNGDALQHQALRLTGPSMVLMIRGVKYCTQRRG